MRADDLPRDALVALQAEMDDLPDDPFEGPNAPMDPESPEWAAAMAVRDERDAAFARMRAILGIDSEDVCIGCYLSDDGPAMHADYNYGCAYYVG